MWSSFKEYKVSFTFNISIIHDIYRPGPKKKWKKNMIFLIDAKNKGEREGGKRKKNTWQNPTTTHEWWNELGMKRNFLNLVKVTQKNLQLISSYLMVKDWNHSPQRSRERQRCLFLHFCVTFCWRFSPVQ